MIWFLLQKLGFYIFLILTIYYVVRKEMLNLMKLYFWGMTFATCYQFAITIWFPTKVIVMAMMVCMLIYKDQRRESVVPSQIISFVAVFLIAILLGDLIAFMFPGEYAKQISKFSRIFNTNYTYITSLALLFFGTMLPSGFVKKIYPSYCLAMEVAIGFGLLHFFCLKVGIEFMPILRQDGSVNLEALAQMGNQIVARVYGVSGEPKSLGFLICPYLLLLLVMYCKKIYRYNNPRYHLAIMTIGLFVLINTYSSSALINFFIATPLILFFLPIDNLMNKLIPLAISIIVLVFIYNTFTSSNTDSFTEETSFSQAMYERTFGRAKNEMEGDRQERIILDAFAEENIFFQMAGYGPAQYTFHIPGQTIGNALIPVQSGFVLTLVDFGLIGIIILFWYGIKIFNLLKISYETDSTYALGFTVACMSSFIGSLMFGSLVTSFIFFMIAMYAYYDEVAKWDETQQSIVS